MRGRILSLCCGHGVFENLLRLEGRQASVVSIDASLVNLLVTRNFIAEAGNFICHDVQFPLRFEAVTSAACSPRRVCRRSRRSGASSPRPCESPTTAGWCFFDQIWSLQTPVQRIDPLRQYRFCQNFFEKLVDYLPFFEECGNGRRIAIDVPEATSRYLDDDHWLFDLEDAIRALREERDLQMSVLVFSEPGFAGLSSTDHGWLRPEVLRTSPVFASSSSQEGPCRRLHPRLEPPWPGGFAPKSFPGFPPEATIDHRKLGDRAYLTELFCDAVAVPCRVDSMLPSRP